MTSSTKEVRALGTPLHATALLTHLHFDHILGIPFFGPLHDPGARLTVHGPAQPKGSLKDALHAAVQPPVFPIHMEQFRGELITVDTRDEDFSVGSAKVMARAHPARRHRRWATGSRPRVAPWPTCPTTRRRSTAAPSPRPCSSSARASDLLVHDGQYTDDEFSDKADWGHSTAAFAVHVAAEAGAKRLLLSHHDPSHTDRELDRILHAARRLPEAKNDRGRVVGPRGPVDRPRQGVGNS